ncbi:MAG TPA: hypothetical protein VN428_18055 [Bryobacteraceae bacterium]|nr:hypothetical protein [Bryobacteraceae bacterium]
MRKWLLLFAAAGNIFAASPLIVGARGGLSLNNGLDTLTNRLGFSPGNREYAIGPTFGVRLPYGLSVEGDALWHRQTVGVGDFGGFSANAHVDSWQVPVMLKFTAGDGSIAPVFGAGASYRRMNESDLGSYLFNGFSGASTNSVGFVAGGGVRFRAGPVNITPELRYTRWNRSGMLGNVIDTVIGSNNQTELMVGFTF